MRDVAIIGIGQTPVGEHWHTGLRNLAGDAVRAALADAGLSQVDALYAASAYSATWSSQSQVAALIADYTGLSGIEAYGIEAGEASGGAALRAGYLAVASGVLETALVVGVEKSSDTVGNAHAWARNTSLDADFEAAQGATITALAALLMRRYMHEYHLELSAFEGFSINAHRNGQRNTQAMYRNVLKAGVFAQAPMISDPVSLFDNAPDGDGAAAVILAPAKRAVDMVSQPIQIAGSAVATDSFALQDRSDLLFLKAVHRSAKRAFKQAQISAQDVDLFELHDAFTILTTLTLEAAGFAERGEGWKFAEQAGSRIALDGTLPISTFGGMKSRGNPVGAAGLYQAVEGCMQLRGVAGANQVRDAKIALIQNLGGLGSTAVTHILRA